MIDIDTITLYDIDVLLHDRVYFESNDDGCCDTRALVKITLQDRLKRELVFYAEADAENHSEDAAADELVYEIHRDNYDQILIEEIPIILASEHDELNSFIDDDSSGWRDAIRIVMAGKDPEETQDYR